MDGQITALPHRITKHSSDLAVYRSAWPTVGKRWQRIWKVWIAVECREAAISASVWALRGVRWLSSGNWNVRNHAVRSCPPCAESPRRVRPGGTIHYQCRTTPTLTATQFAAHASCTGRQPPRPWAIHERFVAALAISAGSYAAIEAANAAAIG